MDIAKLKIWQGLTFPEFITELNTALKNDGKARLTNKEEFDWVELFSENSQASQKVKSIIQKTEQTLDDLIIELYELNKSEIALIDKFRFN